MSDITEMITRIDNLLEENARARSENPDFSVAILVDYGKLPVEALNPNTA